MRRRYITPRIAVERYELTQTIADCSVKIGAQGSTDCVITDGDAPDQMKDLAYEFGSFISTGPCEDVAKGDEYADGICYHTNTVLTFHS